MTISACAHAAAGVLVSAGFSLEDAWRDTAVLARHVLGWTTAQWAARTRDEAPADLEARLAPLIRRRASHEPVAYITGTREFYGRPFAVSPAVLVPRPETEAVIDEALKFLADREHPLVVDVGTGSGCLAITIALECPAARVIATDISRAALDAARANAVALGAAGMTWVETSILPPTPEAVDLIVSNPPYIPDRDRASLPADVLDFEPSLALFGGSDGLRVIRPLVGVAREALCPGGTLIMEIGLGQADAVADLIRGSGLTLERMVPDLQGIPRTVVALNKS